MWCGAWKRHLQGRWRDLGEAHDVDCLRCLKAIRRYHEQLAAHYENLEEQERQRRTPARFPVKREQYP